MKVYKCKFLFILEVILVVALAFNSFSYAESDLSDMVLINGKKVFTRETIDEIVDNEIDLASILYHLELEHYLKQGHSKEKADEIILSKTIDKINQGLDRLIKEYIHNMDIVNKGFSSLEEINELSKIERETGQTSEKLGEIQANYYQALDDKLGISKEKVDKLLRDSKDGFKKIQYATIGFNDLDMANEFYERLKDKEFYKITMDYLNTHSVEDSTLLDLIEGPARYEKVFKDLDLSSSQSTSHFSKYKLKDLEKYTRDSEEKFIGQQLNTIKEGGFSKPKSIMEFPDLHSDYEIVFRGKEVESDSSLDRYEIYSLLRRDYFDSLRKDIKVEIRLPEIKIDKLASSYESKDMEKVASIDGENIYLTNLDLENIDSLTKYDEGASTKDIRNYYVTNAILSHLVEIDNKKSNLLVDISQDFDSRAVVNDYKNKLMETMEVDPKDLEEFKNDKKDKLINYRGILLFVMNKSNGKISDKLLEEGNIKRIGELIYKVEFEDYKLSKEDKNFLKDFNFPYDVEEFAIDDIFLLDQKAYKFNPLPMNGKDRLESVVELFEGLEVGEYVIEKNEDSDWSQIYILMNKEEDPEVLDNLILQSFKRQAAERYMEDLFNRANIKYVK